MNNTNWIIKCEGCGEEKKYSTYDGYYEANRLRRVLCRGCATKKRWNDTSLRSKYDRHICKNQRFGKLVVLSDRVGIGNQVECLCDCGNVLKKRAARLLDGENNGCKKCLVGAINHRWRGVGRVPKIVLTRIRHHAKSKKRECNVSLKYLSELFEKQEGKCALSGLDLDFGVSNTVEQTASLDRIDSSLGYIIGNVQWVHKNVNWMKQDMSDGDFLTMCRTIVDYNDKS